MQDIRRQHRGLHLGHLLLGSAIGAGIGMVLLALGIALVLRSMEQRVPELSEPDPKVFAPTPAQAEPVPDTDAVAGEQAYPQLDAGNSPVASSVGSSLEALPQAPSESWQSVFDDDERRAVQVPQVVTPAPLRRQESERTQNRHSTPREKPQPQKQDDSLFF